MNTDLLEQLQAYRAPKGRRGFVGTWHARFLVLVAQTGNAEYARNVVFVSRMTICDHRKRDPLFDKLYYAALDYAFSQPTPCCSPEKPCRTCYIRIRHGGRRGRQRGRKNGLEAML